MKIVYFRAGKGLPKIKEGEEAVPLSEAEYMLYVMLERLIRSL